MLYKDVLGAMPAFSSPAQRRGTGIVGAAGQLPTQGSAGLDEEVLAVRRDRREAPLRRSAGDQLGPLQVEHTGRLVGPDALDEGNPQRRGAPQARLERQPDGANHLQGRRVDEVGSLLRRQ